METSPFFGCYIISLLQVIAAAKQGHYAVGYELNLWLVLYSRWKAFTNGVHKRTEFYRKDLWKVNIIIKGWSLHTY